MVGDIERLIKRQLEVVNVAGFEQSAIAPPAPKDNRSGGQRQGQPGRNGGQSRGGRPGGNGGGSGRSGQGPSRSGNGGQPRAGGATHRNGSRHH